MQATWAAFVALALSASAASGRATTAAALAAKIPPATQSPPPPEDEARTWSFSAHTYLETGERL
jgi:hypothetical protein